MGKLIVIEGIDGSGKNTQAKKMVELLQLKGYTVSTTSFPNYDSFFGKEIANYLNGGFGEIKALHPKLIAMLYAGDRYLSKPMIQRMINESHFTILDRYVSSNLSHQVCKLENEADRQELSEWIIDLEYKQYGLPQPDATIFLNVPPFFSDKLVLKKDARNYTDKKKDLHEADKNHLVTAYNIYMDLAAKTPNWHILECTQGDQLCSIDDISERLLNLILSV